MLDDFFDFVRGAFNFAMQCILLVIIIVLTALSYILAMQIVSQPLWFDIVVTIIVGTAAALILSYLPWRIFEYLNPD